MAVEIVKGDVAEGLPHLTRFLLLSRVSAAFFRWDDTLSSLLLLLLPHSLPLLLLGSPPFFSFLVNSSLDGPLGFLLVLRS
jgi:hypothetical protein